MNEQVVSREEVTTSVPNAQLILSGAHADFMKQRINVQEVVSTLYQSLGALEWNQKERKWRKTSDDPLVTMAVLERIVNIFQGYVNHNNIHGNISDREAHEFTFDICEEITFFLAFDGPRLGLKSENLGFIVKISEACIFMTLSRAVDDGERTHEGDMFKSNQRSEGKQISGAKI